MAIKCPICSSTADSSQSSGFDGEQITCPRCGEYRITGTARAILPTALNGDVRKIANVCGWLRQHLNIQISSDLIDSLLNLPTPRVPERALNLLAFLDFNTRFIGDTSNITKDACEKYLGVSSSSNWYEVEYLLEFLLNENLINSSTRMMGGFINVRITPSGFSYLEQSRFSNAESQLGFCAMWFDPSVTSIWTSGISVAIRDAGYEPKRIDEHPHNNRIDDEIIALIRRSKFVVADFTGQRGGVYFEAGFALGMNLPVIWTIEKTELNSVHFDNRQYNFVTWEKDNIPEFKLHLQYRIEATLGRGKYQAN